MTPYLLIGLVAGTIAFVLTPGVRWMAVKINAVDHPNDRKVHARATPTLGGLALLAGILGALAVAFNMPEFRDAFTQSSEMLGIVAGSCVIFALGTVDDLRDLPGPVKLAGQVFAAGIVFLSGVKMHSFPLPPQTDIVLSDDVSVIVTVLWLVAMMNAVNLVDGLDGLAAGIVAIAGSSFFVYTYQITQDVSGFIDSAPILCIAVVGACLGFLRYNFHPAKIFMGDSGAMVLGLVLGGATVIGIGNAGSVNPSSVFLQYVPLLIPIAVIAIPLLDGVLAIIRRTRRRRSVFHADKEHLHHRLMDLGHGHRTAVLVMYAWSALAAGAGLAFTFRPRDLIFALPIAVAAIVVYTLFPILTKAIRQRIAP
jgi:UDP-GlcNAc:undecaprenyl-phosphate/decaprenyl-phosphate GlcNAc-1-phosphate transferase